LLPLRGRLAIADGGDCGVAPHRKPELGAGAHERHARTQRQRQPQRVGLDRSARDDAVAERDGGKAALDLRRLHASLGEQPAGRRVRAPEDVRAEVEPHVAARLRADPAAEPFRRLEHDHVEAAEMPGGGKSGDPAADDDDVVGRVNRLGDHETLR